MKNQPNQNEQQQQQEQIEVPPNVKQQTIELEPTFFERNKWLVKGAIIIFLTLLFLIPQLSIQSLVIEREERQDQVVKDISKSWSNEQIIAGPVLVLPYKLTYEKKEADGKTSISSATENVYIMPEDLNVNCNVVPEIRRKGMFKVGVYNATVDFKGNFKNIKWDKLGIDQNNVDWAKAKILIGITDFKGLNKQVELNWNNTKQIAEIGFEDKSVIANPMSVSIPFTPEDLVKEHPFSFQLSLRGTKNIQFIPVANQTNVSLKSAWQTPLFIGNFAASYSDPAKLNATKADWAVMGVNRSFPQIWKGNAHNIYNDAFGMSLVKPLDTYAQIMRCVKYAMLFILLTFLIYFFVEVLCKKSAHIIQYGLVGLALTVFYLLLLSFAEFLGFNLGYWIAAFATIVLLGGYTKAVFIETKTSIAFTGFLALLYAFLFILIQLQDNALLVGSIGIFIILATVMYLSRNMNWNTKK